MATKFKHSELRQIIKEEIARINKINDLQQEKTNIVKQLNECSCGLNELSPFEGEADMEEGILSLGKNKTPEELENMGWEVAVGHPTKNAIFVKLQKENPEKAKTYLQFLGANPLVKQIKWDETTQKFADAAKANSGLVH